tara:strand:- start:4847 stop:6784 length:1938 start_codon:yes stop_codon:yes gene_type:complete
MKDSNKKSRKSSSDFIDPVKNNVPEMPKDKRTKAYKEWVKKYGDQTLKSVSIPEMPKDKRTKAYKEWSKKYGDYKLTLTNKEPSTKSDEINTKKNKTKSDDFSDKLNLFVEYINSENWFKKRKEIEELRSSISKKIKDNKLRDNKKSGTIFFESLKIFSIKKRKYFNNLNLNQKENLSKRQDLINKIKDLIVVDENPNKLYSKFKLLKEEWHNTGQVPITDRNNIWETYRHHVSNFYDFLHLNRDLRELDFKHNHEEKLKIINKAEQLDKVDDIIKASRDLNDLHRLWKNELGPVAREHNDDLWSRFQSASQKIHLKRQKLQKEISITQNENYEKKQAIISKMRELSSNLSNTHSDWQNKIKNFEKLKVEFQNIKNLQKNKNKKSWNDFRIVAKEFNFEKNNFYKNQKKELKKGIEKKKLLIEEVDRIINENKISENSKRIKEIQDEWKKVGYLPRKISNSLWNDFKPLVNKFYDILKSGAVNLNDNEKEIYDKKYNFIDKLKFSKLNSSSDQIKDEFISLIKSYNEIGELNLNSTNTLNNSLLRKVISIIKPLEIDKNEKDNLMFDIELELTKTNSNEINKKIQNIKRKISDLEVESNQFQNNLEYFSNSSSDNPLFKNVSTKIESIEKKIDFWRDKLKKIEKV